MSDNNKQLSENLTQTNERVDKIFAITVLAVIAGLSLFLIVVDLQTLEFYNDLRIFGPGAFPFAVFVLMIGLCVWNAAEVITGKGSSAKLSKHIDFLKIVKSMRLYLLIVASLLFMHLVGFVLAMMTFTFTEMKFLSEKKVSLPKIMTTSIILPLAIFYVFKWLNVSLPSPDWMPL